METIYLQTGFGFTPKDFFNMWDWRIDEEGPPRTTRWISWNLDVLNVKFRAWLWHFIPPHPSLSITWPVSLFINPWLLFIYLKKRKFPADLALTVTAFYLMTPYVLSSVFLLGRTGRIVAQFFMLTSLAMVCLIEEHPRKKLYPLGFYLSLMLGAFCDETAVFIFPLLFVLHPDFIFRRMRWLKVLFVVFLIAVAYVWAIKIMSHYVSGTPLMGLISYDVVQGIFKSDYIRLFINNLGMNTLAPVSQIMGLVGLHPQASLTAKILFSMGALAWLALAAAALLRQDLWEVPLKKIFPWVALFCLTCLFHDFLLSSVCNQIWGAYGYGSYFSIVVPLALAAALRFLKLGIMLRTLLIACILCSMGHTFLYTNKFLKNVNCYHLNGQERFIFDGTVLYFDPAVRTVFKDSQLKDEIYAAWKFPEASLQWHIPNELFWIPIELNGFKKNSAPTAGPQNLSSKDPIFIDLGLNNVLDFHEGKISYQGQSDYEPFGGNKNLAFSPSQSDAKIGFMLGTNLRSFKGDMSVFFSTAPDAAVVKLFLNKIPLPTAAPIDMYAPRPGLKKIELRNVVFKAGPNILLVKVIGRNSHSTAMSVSINAVGITPLKE